MMLRRSFLIATLALVAACDEDPNEPTGTALIRFVNAAPGAEPLNVVSGSTTLASGMTYGGVSACVEVPVGRPVNFQAAGGTVSTLPPGFLQANSRNVVVLTAGATLLPIVAPQNSAAPGASQTRYQFVNASGRAVDLHVTEPGATLGTPTVANIAPRAATNFLPFPVGTNRVRITAQGSTSTVFTDLNPVTFGPSRTAVTVFMESPANTFTTVSFEPCV